MTEQGSERERPGEMALGWAEPITSPAMIGYGLAESVRELRDRIDELEGERNRLHDALMTAPTPEGLGIPVIPLYAGWYERSRRALSEHDITEPDDSPIPKGRQAP